MAGLSIAELEERIASSPFNTWMGVEILSADEEKLVCHVKVRPEMLGAASTKAVHGGILAALIDAVCSYVALWVSGGYVATIDLRTDYHRALKGGEMRIEGKMLKSGRQVSSAEASIYDDQQKLIASGRAVIMHTGE